MSEPVVPFDETPRPPVCRRRFLTLLGMAGAGLWVSRNPDNAVRFWEQTKDFLATIELPETTRPLAAVMTGPYAAFLTNAGLQHIPIKTILAPHQNQHGTVPNSLPPRSLWANIVPTLKVADRLAADLGERIRINSVYRSPAYNATCPGAAKWSQHLRNRAMDIRFQSPPAVVAKLARALRDQGVFQGGVGLYENFVHIDTRGFNADWD